VLRIYFEKSKIFFIKNRFKIYNQSEKKIKKNKKISSWFAFNFNVKISLKVPLQSMEVNGKSSVPTKCVCLAMHNMEDKTGAKSINNHYIIKMP
jgi:hypothetical protein